MATRMQPQLAEWEHQQMEAGCNSHIKQRGVCELVCGLNALLCTKQSKQSRDGNKISLAWCSGCSSFWIWHLGLLSLCRTGNTWRSCGQQDYQMIQQTWDSPGWKARPAVQPFQALFAQTRAPSEKQASHCPGPQNSKLGGRWRLWEALAKYSN